MRFRALILVTLVFTLFIGKTFAQREDRREPRQEKFLNDLKLLIWTAPDTDKLTVKLRIHSGSAFDPKDKMGTLALLADSIFPGDSIKKFIEDELEGSLEITSNYDYIQINVTAKSNELITVLETLSTAVINPEINKSVTAKIISERLELIRQLESDPNYVAERLVSERLFGEFPYGRPQAGTAESLGKIDFADIIFAKQRFLTSDNATLSIISKTRSASVYRAARRLFGGWQKRREKVSTSFRLPDEPSSVPLLVSGLSAPTYDRRTAFESVHRNHKDYFAAMILAETWGEKHCGDWEFKNTSYFLRGIFAVNKKASVVPADGIIKTPPKLNRGCRPFLLNTANGTLPSSQISETLFAAAKNRVVSGFLHSTLDIRDLAERWLDTDTYAFASADGDFKKLSLTTRLDVERFAESIVEKLRQGKYVEVFVSPETTKTGFDNNDPDDPR